MKTIRPLITSIMISILSFAGGSVAFAAPDYPAEIKNFHFRVHLQYWGLDRAAWGKDFDRFMRKIASKIPHTLHTGTVAFPWSLPSQGPFLGLAGTFERQLPTSEALSKLVTVEEYAILTLNLAEDPSGRCTYFSYPEASRGYMEAILEELKFYGFINHYYLNLVRDPDCPDRERHGGIYLVLYYTTFRPSSGN